MTHNQVSQRSRVPLSNRQLVSLFRLVVPGRYIIVTNITKPGIRVYGRAPSLSPVGPLKALCWVTKYWVHLDTATAEAKTHIIVQCVS